MSRDKDYIALRAVEIALFTIENNSTVRETAKHFGISKSTVHKDLTERLPKINSLIAAKVNDVLEINKAERHIRGGIATRESFTRQRESNETN